MPFEMKSTVELMCSENYKDRFIAEYWQTKHRYEKLKALCVKIEAATCFIPESALVKEPKHDCPLSLLEQQLAAMGNYLHCLEVRSVIEHIEIGLGGD